MTLLAFAAVSLCATFIVLGIWWTLTGAWQEHRARRVDAWAADWRFVHEHHHVRVLPDNVRAMRTGA